MSIGMVLVADEACFLPALDITGKIIDVCSGLRSQPILLDCELINICFGFDEASLVGKNATGEILEHRVVFHQEFFVRVIDV